MCVDAKGNIWIATGNGLNMFNGKTTEKYFSSEYPQLKNSNIVQVECDSLNRMWVLTTGGNVTVLDENRKFHRVALYDTNRFVRTIWMLKTRNGTISLYTGSGNYTFSNSPIANTDSISVTGFNYLPLKGFRELKLKGGNQVFNYDEDYYLLLHQEAFIKINSKKNIVERKYSIPECRALAKWADNELLVFDKKTQDLKIINLLTEEVRLPFKDTKDQFGKNISGSFLSAGKISNTRYLFTTEASGMYIYDITSGRLTNYRHSFSDPTSLASNNSHIVCRGKDGWIFVSCLPNGISYFNINEAVRYRSVFTSADGKGYDGYLAGIDSKDNDTYYIGTTEGMLEWKRSTNTTNFIDFKGADGQSIFKNGEVTSVAVDDRGNIWATVNGDGLIVMDKNRKLIKHFRKEEGNKRTLKQQALSRIKLGPDGFIWACGLNGICRINTKTFEVDNLENSPLKQFDSLYVILPLFTDKDNLWLQVRSHGIYHYNFSTKNLEEHGGFKKYKKSEGVFDFGLDSSGNLYVGNTRGVKIFFKDGREKIITKNEGLLIDRAEAFLLDKHNRMWIGNDIGLVCYNPADSSLKVFDERFGLTIYGFRVGAYFQMPNGEFVFGASKGLQYFHPDSLYNKKISLNVLISKIETKNIVSSMTDNTEFNLKARDNQVTFHFSSVEFSPHVRTYYEYKLVDLDKDWIKIADQNSVRYNFLPPGKYVFKVRVSNDNKYWQDAGNEVTIVIAKFFYQTWWFKAIGIFVGVFLIWYVLKYYEKKQLKKREELETEVVINYFASQINRHQRTEDILWDVAKNCISKLNFEDCVIYLLDEKRNMLVQKAAWGPKMAKDFTIYQPIELPVGKGIVGSVAQSGKPELIANTELDKRYVADDVRRFSELTVPLIIDNKLIGIIDSEHSRKNFFTKRHLNILSTVAVLCATQIKRANAEQEELEAQLVIDYFASQIHSRLKTDDLLWDVAKNLIGKMGFEECMIYLWNDDKTLLIQKAGYGAKGSMEARMDKTAYHIQRGKGIVGAAVESKQSLLVNDTSEDTRYFTADEKIMLSELCVPLVHDNEVLGAINIEHQQKNFFTAKHQKMLSTIAMLCANQLQRIRAEEEKQQARIEALQNKQKAVETRLQSLRLQMNPHFLFNALNSIQQMILANEDMVATRYLSKFSKLLRTILVHSDKEFVTLKEELEILNLYIELESIRFKGSFTYNIECDESIDTDEIKLPTLLIQPFVENAIWHGLMHKEGERLLQIKFSEPGDSIHCIIEDNGVGREKSREAKLATGQGKKHTSKGIQVSMERLEAMGNGNGCKGSLDIIDLKDEKGNAAGTRVKIIFPTQNT